MLNIISSLNRHIYDAESVIDMTLKACTTDNSKKCILLTLKAQYGWATGRTYQQPAIGWFTGANVLSLWFSNCD